MTRRVLPALWQASDTGGCRWSVTPPRAPRAWTRCAGSPSDPRSVPAAVRRRRRVRARPAAARPHRDGAAGVGGPAPHLLLDPAGAPTPRHCGGRAVAAEVTVPVDWGCCGFAGDRGLLHPELTASATAREAAEVAASAARRLRLGQPHLRARDEPGHGPGLRAPARAAGAGDPVAGDHTGRQVADQIGVRPNSRVGDAGIGWSMLDHRGPPCAQDPARSARPRPPPRPRPRRPRGERAVGRRRGGRGRRGAPCTSRGSRLQESRWVGADLSGRRLCGPASAATPSSSTATCPAPCWRAPLLTRVAFTGCRAHWGRALRGRGSVDVHVVEGRADLALFRMATATAPVDREHLAARRRLLPVRRRRLRLPRLRSRRSLARRCPATGRAPPRLGARLGARGAPALRGARGSARTRSSRSARPILGCAGHRGDAATVTT